LSEHGAGWCEVNPSFNCGIPPYSVTYALGFAARPRFFAPPFCFRDSPPGSQRRNLLKILVIRGALGAA